MEQPDILSLLEVATHEPASSLHFVPARPRARLDGWTEARQRRFVAALAATGHAGRAAEMAGMTEQSARWLWRRPDGASFGAACGAAFTFAKIARRARAAARQAEGSQGAKDFSFLQASLSSTDEPSAEPFASAGRSGRPAPRGGWHV